MTRGNGVKLNTQQQRGRTSINIYYIRLNRNRGNNQQEPTSYSNSVGAINEVDRNILVYARCSGGGLDCGIGGGGGGGDADVGCGGEW